MRRPKLQLSNFIPADRWLAGHNKLMSRGGGRRVGTRKTFRGDQRRSRSSSSTDLETIDFIPAFAAEEGKWCRITGRSRRT